MAIHDFMSQRLHVAATLAPGASVPLTREQANYLLNVLRLTAGSRLLVFNGRDGEWQAEVTPAGRRDASLLVLECTRPQTPPGRLIYMFAPLKRARLDYMVQKATELGAGRLVPVLTRRTVAERVNIERLTANVIEAAEQCGVLAVPAVDEPQKFEPMLAAWPAETPLIFCDEEARVRDPLAVLRQLAPGPAGVLIGPEGGFDPAERAALLAKPFTVPLSLGPRIMRADTAAVAALSLVNAVLGDWR